MSESTAPHPRRSREALVAAAARLFAERGYARTSVADIQVACGMTPGSGALYKHFASKEALLEAVVDSHVGTMRAGARWFEDSLPEDPDQALRLTATAVVEAIEQDRDAVRVMLRELDDFPALRERMWTELTGRVYAPFTTWVVERSEREGLGLQDPVATATVLLAGLTSLPLLEALLGQGPGDLDTLRQVEAWSEMARAILGVRR